MISTVKKVMILLFKFRVCSNTYVFKYSKDIVTFAANVVENDKNIAKKKNIASYNYLLTLMSKQLMEH